MCPPECTGGCANNECVIDCASNDCDGQTNITCPPNFACKVLCNGEDSCDHAQIECPDTYSCKLECGNNACNGSFDMYCNGGPCEVHCDPEDCQEVTVHCDSGACTAICDGAVPPVVADCGGSCSCNPC